MRPTRTIVCSNVGCTTPHIEVTPNDKGLIGDALRERGWGLKVHPIHTDKILPFCPECKGMADEIKKTIDFLY